MAESILVTMRDSMLSSVALIFPEIGVSGIERKYTNIEYSKIFLQNRDVMMTCDVSPTATLALHSIG